MKKEKKKKYNIDVRFDMCLYKYFMVLYTRRSQSQNKDLKKYNPTFFHS